MVGVGRGGGELIHSKVFWCHERYITKLSIFDPVFQKYSASVFQNWRKIHLLCISMSVVSLIMGMNE